MIFLVGETCWERVAPHDQRFDPRGSTSFIECHLWGGTSRQPAKRSRSQFVDRRKQAGDIASAVGDPWAYWLGGGSSRRVRRFCCRLRRVQSRSWGRCGPVIIDFARHHPQAIQNKRHHLTFSRRPPPAIVYIWHSSDRHCSESSPPTPFPEPSNFF